MKPRTIPAPRAQAALLLHGVLAQQRTLDEALAAQPPVGDDAQTRLVMMLVLTTLRHLGQIDTLLLKYVPKPLPDKRVMAKQGLRLGAVQLLLMATAAHAATNETVQMVKESKDAGLAGLVNAVLHKLIKEKPSLPSAIHNLPLWLRARWETTYGMEAAQAMAEVAAIRPPLDLHASAPMVYAQGERLDPYVWRLASDHEAVSKIDGFNDGKFWVQDIAATYPVRLLGDVAGLAVLDVGAAPGGKTAQLAIAGAQVTALDKSAARMETLKQNMARLRLTVAIEIADALRFQPSHRYDVVLLDAPCSATGTWRRHPEVLAITAQHDITELARQQREMLGRAWRWVKPGGRLLYCVCSLEPEEGEHQAAWFVEHHCDAVLDKASGEAIPEDAITPEGYLRTRPDMLREKGGMDGFFAAVFRKR